MVRLGPRLSSPPARRSLRPRRLRKKKGAGVASLRTGRFLDVQGLGSSLGGVFGSRDLDAPGHASGRFGKQTES